ncbi:MAG TPA: ribosome silencing factor [Burkholderiales bacterium]|nr:ribosome silencing factor [Burkholderiales bacterium]
MRVEKLVSTTVAALEDVKARDIVVLDVRKMTSLFDKVIIASADSTRQGKALSSRVQEKVKGIGAPIHGVEGEQNGEWILVDLGTVIVHIMQPAARQYYNLEELWTPAKRTRRRATRSTRAA